MFVLDVAQKDVVEHRDQVDVKNAVLQRNEEEVDELGWRPHQPVSQVNRHELGPQNFIRLAQRLSSKEERGVEVMQNEHRTHDYLKKGDEFNQYILDKEHFGLINEHFFMKMMQLYLIRKNLFEHCHFRSSRQKTFHPQISVMMQWALRKSHYSQLLDFLLV